jgi:thioredoxin-dependent peroxiredoxin
VRLHAGQDAPLFEIRDFYGRRVALAQYWGRPVLLAFHRAANCPLCNLRLWHLIHRYPTYQRQGMAVLAFFESTPEYAHTYLDRLRPPFPLIADLGLQVYSRYRLESSWLGALRARLTRGAAYREATRLRIGGHPWLNPLTMDGHPGRLPADFLLEPDLRIHTAYYGHDAGDFMLFEEIDAFLAARPWRQVGLL